MWFVSVNALHNNAFSSYGNGNISATLSWSRQFALAWKKYHYISLAFQLHQHISHVCVYYNLAWSYGIIFAIASKHLTYCFHIGHLTWGIFTDHLVHVACRYLSTPKASLFWCQGKMCRRSSRILPQHRAPQRESNGHHTSLLLLPGPPPHQTLVSSVVVTTPHSERGLLSESPKAVEGQPCVLWWIRCMPSWQARSLICIWMYRFRSCCEASFAAAPCCLVAGERRLVDLWSCCWSHLLC